MERTDERTRGAGVEPDRPMPTLYRLGYWSFRALANVVFSYRVYGRENLIENGPALIASNHVSFLDPPMVGVAFEGPIYYLARKTLFKGPLGWLYRKWNSIPVDQERADFTSLKKIVRLLREGDRVLIFPEGQRSITGELLDGQPGVGLVIAKARAPVVPVRIFGTFEALPRGASGLRRSKITVVVGKPIAFSDDDFAGGGKDVYRAVSHRVMSAIGELQLPPGRQPR